MEFSICLMNIFNIGGLRFEQHDISVMKRYLFMRIERTIIGETVRLESFSDTYLTDRYLNWLKNEKVNQYLIKPDKDITLYEARQYCQSLLESDNNYFLAIIYKNTNTHIGNLRVGPITQNGKLCQLSLMIGDTDYYGKGIATEVIRLCSKFAFENLKVFKLFMDVIDDNKAAIRVYEKNGFHTEGLLKKHLLLKGKYHDLRILSKFNQDELCI